MNEIIQVTLPKLGESIMNATIVQWFKTVGDVVQLDEALLEVSTDKVNSEIPSPAFGILKTIVVQPDQEVSVGDVLATIEVRAAGGDQTVVEKGPKQQEIPNQVDDMRDFYSPALLKMAREKGVSLNELEKISGTGSGGRLSKKDLEEHLERHKKPCPMKIVPPSAGGLDIERVKMSGMRKAIADNMVRSFYEAPHATLVTEVDVTESVNFIQRHKEEILTKYGSKLTITAFVAKAICKALQEFPFLNSSLEQDTIVVKRFVNLGIAVSVDQGIMVPVVRHCQRLSVSDIAKEIGILSQKARSNTLSMTEVSDGTVTLTNFGMSGVAIGISIIRHPEVAIIGIGAIQKKVIVLQNDTFGIRSMMHASLTFDHRVLDGMYGCGFLNAFKKHLEHPPTLQDI